MKELFSIGFVHIYFFGLMIAIGFIAALWFIDLMAKKRQIDENIIFNFAITEIISGVIGARIFFIIFYNPLYYLNHIWDVFKINEGGMSIHGSIFFALIAGIIFSKKNKISFFKLADIAVVGTALAQGIGRVGCDVFGKVMNKVMPWGVSVNNQILHPAQVYEFILDYILFIYLWRKSEKQKYDGELFAAYIIVFPIIRGFVEFFRINPMLWGAFSISHLLSLLLIVVGLIVSKYIRNKNQIEVNEKPSASAALSVKFISLAALITASLIIFYTVQG